MPTIAANHTLNPSVSSLECDSEPRTLSAEHARLLRDLHRRIDPMQALMQRHVWPDAELRTLTGFLRSVVLRQASDEEVLLFPSGAQPPITELTAAHARLHLLTEQLDQADATCCPLPRLASLVEQLLAVLETHLLDEQAVLAALPDIDDAVPGVAELDEPWLSVTAEPVLISLDSRHLELSIRLCIERLLRLRPGQTADIHANHARDLAPIAGWLRRFDAARYGIAAQGTDNIGGQPMLRINRRGID